MDSSLDLFCSFRMFVELLAGIPNRATQIITRRIISHCRSIRCTRHCIMLQFLINYFPISSVFPKIITKSKSNVAENSLSRFLANNIDQENCYLCSFNIEMFDLIQKLTNHSSVFYLSDVKNEETRRIGNTHVYHIDSNRHCGMNGICIKKSAIYYNLM